MNLGAPEGWVVPAVNLVTNIYFMIMYLIFKDLSVYVSKYLVYSTQKSRKIGEKKCTKHEIHVALVKEIYITDNKYGYNDRRCKWSGDESLRYLYCCNQIPQRANACPATAFTDENNYERCAFCFDCPGYLGGPFQDVHATSS